MKTFQQTQQVQLQEFRRLMNIATQVTQLNKSNQTLKSVQSQGSKIESLLRSIKSTDDAMTIYTKMSDALVLLSQMMSSTASIARSSTVSSVSNAVLTKDLTDKINQILRRKR